MQIADSETLSDIRTRARRMSCEQPGGQRAELKPILCSPLSTVICKSSGIRLLSFDNKEFMFPKWDHDRFLSVQVTKVAAYNGYYSKLDIVMNRW